MSSIKSSIARSARKASMMAALGATAVTLAVAGPAHAQPIGNGSGAQGCQIEDEHGNVTYVPVGTQVGLFHCGSDGEWHFGWLVNAIAPPEQTVRPVSPPRVSAAAKARLLKAHPQLGQHAGTAS
jgi:hypothetical protein